MSSARPVQLAGSFLVAVVIVATAVWLVVARLGEDPELTEERAEERAEQADERSEEAEDRRDD